MRIATTRRRLGGILAAVAVDMIEPLGFGVIGFHVFVGDRPGRRDPPVMLNLAKVFFAKSKEGGAKEFCIAADVVVGMRVQLVAVFVAPLLFGLIFSFEIDRARIPVVLFTRHIAAAFEKQ